MSCHSDTTMRSSLKMQPVTLVFPASVWHYAKKKIKKKKKSTLRYCYMLCSSITSHRGREDLPAWRPSLSTFCQINPVLHDGSPLPASPALQRRETLWFDLTVCRWTVEKIDLCIKQKCMWIFKSGLTLKFWILSRVGIFHQPEQIK